MGKLFVPVRWYLSVSYPSSSSCILPRVSYLDGCKCYFIACCHQSFVLRYSPVDYFHQQGSDENYKIKEEEEALKYLSVYQKQSQLSPPVIEENAIEEKNLPSPKSNDDKPASSSPIADDVIRSEPAAGDPVVHTSTTTSNNNTLSRKRNIVASMGIANLDTIFERSVEIKTVNTSERAIDEKTTTNCEKTNPVKHYADIATQTDTVSQATETDNVNLCDNCKYTMKQDIIACEPTAAEETEKETVTTMYCSEAFYTTTDSRVRKPLYISTWIIEPAKNVLSHD